MSTDRYNSPLSERYASKEMQYIFSPDMKFQYLEKTLDCTGRNRERTWLKGCRWKSTYHRRTD